MRTIALAAATAIGLAAAPLAAQTEGAPLGSTNTVSDKRPDMTDEQKAMYDAMPADQRASFDSWPYERQTVYFGWNAALRDYYWTLDPAQQNAWFYLTPEQQVTLYQIQGEEQRDAAWSGVLAQVERMERSPQASSNATRAAYSGANTDIRFVSDAMVQDAPAPHNGEYPVCDSANDDNCMNPWAAGERGPGVARPLGYWPGESSSTS